VEQTPEPEDNVVKAIHDYLTRLEGTPTTRPSVQFAADEQPVPTSLPAEVPASQPVAPHPIAAPSPTTAPAPAAIAMPAAEPAPVLTPPELREVQVHPAADPEPAATAAPDIQPGINAPTFARRSPASLRAFLEETPPPEQASFRDQLDRRMLWVIAGDYDRARAPLELVTAEQQALAARFVEAWIVVRDWHMGDQSAGANAALRELEQLQGELHHLSELTLQQVTICSAVRGFGQYDALQPAEFRAGSSNEFVLYCELRNFVSRQEDGLYTSRFDMTTTVLDRAGQAVLEVHDAELVDHCRNRRHDCFIPRLVRLPATLPPGQYTAKVTIIDKLGEKVAEERATFSLVAR
jgi:hypothetical protein